MRDPNRMEILGAQVAWESSDANAASVNESGLVTAVANGFARITATLDEASAYTTISVMQRPDRITIAPSDTTLTALGHTLQLHAKVLDAGGKEIPDAEVTWESDDENVASVAELGLVTAVANGSTRITANREGVSAYATVTVMQIPDHIAISPSDTTLAVLGQTVQLVATVRDPNRMEILGAQVAWESSDANAASVNESGLVTAVANGFARITATLDEASAYTTISVMQRPDRITIEPSDTTLTALGHTLQLHATVLDAGGKEIPDAEVTWESDDENVASVAELGLVTAVANGTARITANREGVSAYATVTVMQIPDHVTVSPPDTTLTAIGQKAQFIASVFDANGGEISGAQVAWTSSDTTVASIAGDGLVTAVGNGASEIAAAIGNVRGTARIEVSVDEVTGPDPPIGPDPVHTDRDILEILYRATKGPDWIRKDNWLLDHLPLEIWDGVSTTGDERVTDLTLSENGLSGPIPAELGGLSLIRSLWMFGNNLTGSIPATLGDLSELRMLRLQNNDLTGSIPGSLGRLSNLTTLDVENNQLSGNIPSEIGQLENLRNLIVRSNPGMSGILPKSLMQLSNLQSFNTQGTDLCAPRDADFQAWLAGIRRKIVATCPDVSSERRVEVRPFGVTLTTAGETAQLTARVYDAYDNLIPNAAVTWSSSNPAAATVDANGLVTARKRGYPIRIVATSGGATGYALVRVDIFVEVARVKLSHDLVTLYSPGETWQLTATAYDSNDDPVPSPLITWTSRNPDVASVDGNGLVTAHKFGYTGITAAAGSKSDHAFVQVTTRRVVSRVTVSRESVRLYAPGETAHLRASAYDQDDTQVLEAEFTWTSSNTSVATVDSEGVVRAVREGTARITASSGNKSATAVVTISIPRTPDRVTVSPSSARLQTAGATIQFSATVYNNRNYAIPNPTVTWSSSDNGIASVSSSGLVRAVSHGTARIKATSGSVAKEVTVTVSLTTGPPHRITVSPNTLSFTSAGQTATIIAKVFDSSNREIPTADVTWSSDNTRVAAVNSSGLVTARGPGTTYVRASSGSLSKSVKVSVYNRTARIVVSPSSYTLKAIGDKVTLTATVYDSNNAVVTGETILWLSAFEGIATVDLNTGEVTAVAKGVTTIVAFVPGGPQESGRSEITVDPPGHGD